MRRFYILVVLLLVAVGLSAADNEIRAKGFKAKFTDSLDGNFDVSRWLDEAYGIMPLVNLITEPAVGYGVAGGLLFIHRAKEDRGKPLTSPPSMSALMGFYTENGSWGTGAFHEGHWKMDTIRYRGFLGYVSMNLAYYPPILSDRGIGFEYNIEGGGLSQRLEFRIKGSPWFLGADYVFFNNNVKFKLTEDFENVDPWELSLRLGGLGPFAVYDSRDFNFTTNRGIWSQAKFDIYAEMFGSEADYNKFSIYGVGWHPYKSVVFGLRLDGRFSVGDVPFFAQPYVQLRGIPAMRYQGEYALVVETEERWDITRRWALVGFLGLGKAVPDGQKFSDIEAAYSVGAGFRYLLARYYNFYGGIDVARGPEEWAFYIIMGQYWSRL
jgi:hypothetical protein